MSEDKAKLEQALAQLQSAVIQAKAATSAPATPDVVPPKSLKKGRQSAGPTQGKDKGTLENRNTSPAILDLSQLPFRVRRQEQIEDLAAEDAISSLSFIYAVAMAASRIKVTAYVNGTQEFSEQGTAVVQSVISSLNTINDYSKGFSDKPSFVEVVQQLLFNIVTSSGACAELVLDENLLPSHITTFSYWSVNYKADGKGGRTPVQKTNSGEDLELNKPNIFITEAPKIRSGAAYAESLITPSVGSATAWNQFIKDLYSSVNRSGHDRLVATLDIDKVMELMPETLSDEDKLLWLENYRNSKADSLGSVTPDQPIVSYSDATLDTLSGTNMGDYSTILKAFSNIHSSANKTPMSVTGVRGEGSSSVNNVEVLVYLKYLELLQGPVESVLSRALTLAVRLYGVESYVKAEFKPINVRPEEELQPYRSMRQNNLEQLLSIGKLTDAQFCHELDIPYNPAAPQLSGTFYYTNDAPLAEGDVDNTQAMQRTMNAGTPKKSGGKSQ